MLHIMEIVIIVYLSISYFVINPLPSVALSYMDKIDPRFGIKSEVNSTDSQMLQSVL